MEAKVKYITKNIIEKKYHHCPHCNDAFGFETVDGDVVVGALILSYFKGRCSNCGNSIKWYSTDAAMERMIAGKRARK